MNDDQEGQVKSNQVIDNCSILPRNGGIMHQSIAIIIIIPHSYGGGRESTVVSSPFPNQPINAKRFNTQFYLDSSHGNEKGTA